MGMMRISICVQVAPVSRRKEPPGGKSHLAVQLCFLLGREYPSWSRQHSTPGGALDLLVLLLVLAIRERGRRGRVGGLGLHGDGMTTCVKAEQSGR